MPNIRVAISLQIETVCEEWEKTRQALLLQNSSEDLTHAREFARAVNSLNDLAETLRDTLGRLAAPTTER